MKMQGIITALVVLASSSAAGAADLSAIEILNRMRLQASITQAHATPPAGTTAQPAALGDGSQALSREPAPVSDRIELQILFEFNSAQLKPAAISQLQELCTAFHQSTDIARPFRIIGYTDAIGNVAYNQELSEKRAMEVQRYLIEDCNITAGRLHAEGRGESEPVPGLNPRDARQRRVEIRIMG